MYGPSIAKIVSLISVHAFMLQYLAKFRFITKHTRNDKPKRSKYFICSLWSMKNTQRKLKKGGVECHQK